MQKREQLETSTTTPTSAILFVDLDGTLIKTDLLHEGMLQTFKSQPWQLLKALWKLRKGKAAFKQAIAAASHLDARRLPYREEVLQWIAERRAAGDRIVLATASPQVWAQQIADELGIFDDVIASHGDLNLRGKTKLAAMQNYCQSMGCTQFDYVGDSSVDVPIWREARRVCIAEPSPVMVEMFEVRGQEVVPLGNRSSRFSAILRTLRPHQWAKNLLIFVPLITSHRLQELALVAQACLAFLVFCGCASAVYVLNDLLDIDADRCHAKKRERPFAAGRLPLPWGPVIVALLLTLSFGLSAVFLPPSFTVGLGVYLAATTAYSLVLKRIVMLDVITLACLYTARVVAGGLATGIFVSHWLLAFSLFIFVSLAFAKRFVELNRSDTSSEPVAAGRGYQPSDLHLIRSLGPTAGYLSVLILVLYIQSDEMRHLYRQPLAMWLLCPLLLYWISRLWLKADRGELHHDPVVFALRDGVSLLVALLSGLLLYIASIG